jgi:hypothetical protein
VLYVGLSVQVYVSIAEVVADVWPLNQGINGFWENGKPSESLLWGPQTWRSKQRMATSRFIWDNVIYEGERLETLVSWVYDNTIGYTDFSTLQS